VPHQKIKGMISTSDPRVTLIGHPAPAWLVNYADLMTELVCFFIVLYALSASLNKDVQQAKKDVEEAMKKDKVATEVKVTKDGMSITLEENGENVFFESASSDLSPRMDEILSKITPMLKKLALDGHDIVVEGHTDDVPIHNTRYSSNWELSTARATSVVQHMITTLGMPPAHMAAIGYGEFHPIVANDTDEHRAKNRRVVFFVKNTPANFKAGDKKGKKEAVTPDENATAADKPAADQVEATGPPADQNAAPSDDANNSNPIPESHSNDATPGTDSTSN
jgi:flagellar motor protein MotB